MSDQANLEINETINGPMGREFAKVTDLYDGGADVDPYPIFQQMLADSPVIEGDLLARFGAPSQAGNTDKRKLFTLFRYDDIMKVLRDPKRFTSSLLGEGLGQFLDGLMITAMDGAEHRLTRNMLQPAFSPQVIERWRSGLMRDLARDTYATPLVAKKRAELVADFALAYPVHVIYRIIGLTEDKEGFEAFAARGLRILVGPQRDPAKQAAAFADAMAASQELYDSIRPMVEQRRAAGAEGDDLMSHLLRVSYEGRALDDHEITGFLRMLLPAAAETTTRTIGNTLVTLFKHPEVLEAIRADYSLIPAAIDEVARLEPVTTFLARETAEDVEFHGVAIPKGSALSLATGAAGRDERAFPNPDVFDIHRAKRPMFAFGFGPHMCIGMMIAKFEVEEALKAMFDLFPNLRLDPDKPEPKIVGPHMRGPAELNVIWD
ncbi:MAG: cytochrome P450 [Janthinobacterium lividum]